MEISKAAAAACLIVLAVVAAAAAGALPDAGAAKVVAVGNKGAAVAAVSTAAWVEDAAVGILHLQSEAAPLMMMVAAAGGVGDYDYEVHRRVLQGKGGYVNEALVAIHPRCLGSCPPPGGSYHGRGNKCIYHNEACGST